MIDKLVGVLPVIKNGVIKGAAMAAYLIDTMKDIRKKEAFLDPVEVQKNGQQDKELRQEVAQLRAEIQALTKAVQDLRSTILIAD